MPAAICQSISCSKRSYATFDPENGDNWPYTLVLADRISNTMYNHGLTSRLIDITPVIDPEVNARFHIPLPTE